MEEDINIGKIKRVLVTGGSGFIGTNLLDFYLNHRVEVLNLDIASPRNPEHTPYWHSVDILDERKLRNEIKAFSPTHIFHMAARADLDGKDLDDYATNIHGVSNLIKHAKIPLAEAWG